MALYGPQDRELFERCGAPLYEAVLAANGVSHNDPLVTSDQGRRAFDLLVHMGLLKVEGERVVAVDPSPGASLVVSPMGQQGAQLLAESAHWAHAFTGLSQAWRNAPGAPRGLWTEVRGDAIDPFIASVVADAEFELLTAQPQAGRNAAALGVATQRDIAALERGVHMRTLYQHSARRSRITHRYVAAVSERGAEVRTLDEFFDRIILVDRRIAVIPGHEGLHVALAVREPSVVAYLVDLFERTWEHARPFSHTGSTVTRDIGAEQRAMTIRMLIAGHADPLGAKRLGVSPRTYAGYVADLKAEFDAQTRFQLGYEMGRRGVSGQEDDRVDSE